LLWAYMPLVLVAPILLGLVWSVLHPLRSAAVFVPLVILYRAYFRAGHLGMAYYEMLRYLSLLMPVLLVLGLMSIRLLTEELKASTWGWWTRVGAVALVLMILQVPALGWQRDNQGDYSSPIALLDGLEQRQIAIPPLLDRNQQREVRYLLDLGDRYPDCVFITRVSARDRVAPRVEEWQLLAFGGTLPEPVVLQDSGGRIEAQVHLPPELRSSCLLFYRGLDCNLREGDGCVESFAGMKELEYMEFPSAPYHFGRAHGHVEGVVRLSLYGSGL